MTPEFNHILGTLRVWCKMVVTKNISIKVVVSV